MIMDGAPFSPISSRKAEQNSLPAETFSSLFGISITRLLGCIPFGSKKKLTLDLRLPTGEGLAFTFRFRLISAAVGTFNISSRECETVGEGRDSLTSVVHSETWP